MLEERITMRSKLIFLIIGCLMMAAVANINICNADAVDDAESVISGIVMYKIQESGCENEKEWVDYALPQGAGNDSDAYAYGMAKMSGYDLREYMKALKEYLTEHEVKSASTRLKYALCLIPGAPEDPFITEAAENSVGQLGIMSLVFGLHLSNNGYESDTYPAERIIGEIDSLRHEDGGWSVMGQYGDVDVTAMVLQAFAGYLYRAGNDELNDVHTAVSEGLRFLSEKQHEDGGYAGFGADNAESTAQVLLALSDLGIDAEQDDRFIKNGKSIFDGLDRYRLSDGSYSHTEGAESNPTATMQVFTAMVAYKGMKDGRAPYYV